MGCFEMPTPESRKFVLVGGGHAHIQVLEDLAENPLPRDDVHVVLVVDKPIAVYSGMVPGVVAGQYQTRQLQIDVRPWASRAGVELCIGRVVGLDPRNRIIQTEDSKKISYDLASFDIGSTVTGLDLPGVREHALATRPIDAFIEKIDRLLSKSAERNSSEPFHLVVVGGGAGGVELAFTLQHRLQSVTDRLVATTIIESGQRILKGLPESIAKRAERWCCKRGLTIKNNERVTSVNQTELLLESGEYIRCDTLVWVTGPTSQPLFTKAGLSTERRGFVHVRPTLQFVDHDNLFAAGDCATLIDYPNTPKAGVHAVRQGALLAKNLRATLNGTPLRKYKPQGDFLMLLNLGGGHAIGAKWGRSFEGKWVMTLKDQIDRRFMKRFQIS